MRNKKPLASRMHRRAKRNQQARKEMQTGRWRGKEWPWKKPKEEQKDEAVEGGEEPTES